MVEAEIELFIQKKANFPEREAELQKTEQTISIVASTMHDLTISFTVSSKEEDYISLVLSPDNILMFEQFLHKFITDCMKEY